MILNRSGLCPSLIPCLFSEQHKYIIRHRRYTLVRCSHPCPAKQATKSLLCAKHYAKCEGSEINSIFPSLKNANTGRFFTRCSLLPLLQLLPSYPGPEGSSPVHQSPSKHGQALPREGPTYGRRTRGWEVLGPALLLRAALFCNIPHDH